MNRKVERAFLLTVAHSIVDLDHEDALLGERFLAYVKLHVNNIRLVLGTDHEVIGQELEGVRLALEERVDSVRTVLSRKSSEEVLRSARERRLRAELFELLEGLE